MEKFLREQGGKKVIGWDEIIDGGAVPNTVVMAYRGHARAIRAARQNQYTILTQIDGVIWIIIKKILILKNYACFYFCRWKKCIIITQSLIPWNTASINIFLGHQGSLWTEYISNTNRAEYMMFPVHSHVGSGLVLKEQKLGFLPSQNVKRIFTIRL